jgi:hypothetical protein
MVVGKYMINFSPNGMYVWDTWYLADDDGTTHVYFLQRLRPGSKYTQFDEDSIGHAISKDLIT